MAETRFITPLDVLFPRGNKLFGEAGQHGEAQMPPWPAMVAGAIRSYMLAAAGADLGNFSSGTRPEGPLGEAIGTPNEPGSFRVAWFSLAVRKGGTVEPVLPLPADLFATEDDENILYGEPSRLPDALKSGLPLPCLPVLRQIKSNKPEEGRWLSGAGLRRYLHGTPLSKREHTIDSSHLWRTDARLGIAMDSAKRAAEQGRLYTTEGIAFASDWSVPAAGHQTGFLTRVEGADGLVPRDALIRLGGDGRGARMEFCDSELLQPDWDRIGREKRFRLVLSTPGLFETGWRIPGLSSDGIWHGPAGFTARLVSAAVSRPQVVSGWDLAKRKPKSALRAAPAGSVYWFEAPSVTGAEAALQQLATEGFGCIAPYPDKARLAEGFNNVIVANWTDVKTKEDHRVH